MELNQLSQALRAGTQGKSELAGLDEEYARAQAMQKATSNQRAGAAPNYAGGLLDAFQAYRGGKQMRDIRPQRNAARQTIAENANALPMYQARVNADKVTQDQENFDSTALATTAAARLKANALVKSTQQKQDREDEKVPTISKVDPTTGKEHTVRYNAQTGKAFLDNGTEITNYSEWTDPAKKNITFAGGGYDDKSANKRAEETIITLGKINTAIGHTTEFDDDTVARLNSFQERGLKGLLEMAPSQLKQLIQSERESNPAVKKYYAYLSGLSGAQRHALFGSALTNVEKMSADEFLAGVSTIPLDDQVMRLRNGIGDGTEALRIMDNIHGGKSTRYTDSFNSMGFTNLAEPEPAPAAPAVYTNDQLDGMSIEQLREIAGQGVPQL